MITAPNASAIQPLTPEQMSRYLEALREDFDNANVIYQRENRIVIRWRDAVSDQPLIIKMWARPDLKNSLRQLLRIAPCDHEWRALVQLHGINMSVPRPLGHCRVRPRIAGYTGALFTEDLGKCESATSYLKRLMHTGQEQQVLHLENTLINMAWQILDAGIIDPDHGLINTVVQASGQLVRLDFELARYVIWPRLYTGMYSHMLGQMILFHAFSVQPDIDRTTRFAERLHERLHPSRRVLARAGIYVRERLEQQYKYTGIDTRLILPWT